MLGAYMPLPLPIQCVQCSIIIFPDVGHCRPMFMHVLQLCMCWNPIICHALKFSSQLVVCTTWKSMVNTRRRATDNIYPCICGSIACMVCVHVCHMQVSVTIMPKGISWKDESNLRQPQTLPLYLGMSA